MSTQVCAAHQPWLRTQQRHDVADSTRFRFFPDADRALASKESPA